MLNQNEVIRLYTKALDNDDYLGLTGTKFSFTKNFLSACGIIELNYVKDHLSERIDKARKTALDKNKSTMPMW